MYKDAADTYKTSCYSNCEKIETTNQEKDVNGEQGNNDVTDTNEGTIITDEEVVTEADCNTMCNSSIWLAATAEERADCTLSCKVGVRIGSDNINDCNNIETFSEEMFTKDSCIANKAVDQNKIEYCKMVKDEQTIATCYM